MYSTPAPNPFVRRHVDSNYPLVQSAKCHISCCQLQHKHKCVTTLLYTVQTSLGDIQKHRQISTKRNLVLGSHPLNLKKVEGVWGGGWNLFIYFFVDVQIQVLYTHFCTQKKPTGNVIMKWYFIGPEDEHKHTSSPVFPRERVPPNLPGLSPNLYSSPSSSLWVLLLLCLSD